MARGATTPELVSKGDRITMPSPLKPVVRPMWWRLFGYLAVVLPLLFFVVSAWIHPDVEWQRAPDWRAALARADASWNRGDLYEAKHLYLQAGRLASWRDDWEGLVAAACGVRRSDGVAGLYSTTHMVLVRAMMAAESRQSRAGIAAVAKAFKSIGQHKAAAMVLGRVRGDWPEQTIQPAVRLEGCWEPALGDD
jgi:hypothetical protein